MAFRERDVCHVTLSRLSPPHLQFPPLWKWDADGSWVSDMTWRLNEDRALGTVPDT